MVFSMLSASRSIISSIGVFSSTWIRCVSTIPEFIPPPGPRVSWSTEEINAWRRWKYATDTEYRQRVQKINKEYSKDKYANDAAWRQQKLKKDAERRAQPGYRESKSRYNRDRYANDPGYREFQIRYHKHRYANDPEYRESISQYHKHRYANDDFRQNRKIVSRRMKERYANDPEYRELRKQYSRERYWRMKFGLATERGGTSVAQDTSDTPNKSGEQDAKP